MSDLQSTEVEDDIQTKKRKRKPNLKYVISSEDEYNENCDSLQPPAKIDKPGETNIIYIYKDKNIIIVFPFIYFCTMLQYDKILCTFHVSYVYNNIFLVQLKNGHWKTQRRYVVDKNDENRK